MLFGFLRDTVTLDYIIFLQGTEGKLDGYIQGLHSFLFFLKNTEDTI